MQREVYYVHARFGGENNRVRETHDKCYPSNHMQYFLCCKISISISLSETCNFSDLSDRKIFIWILFCSGKRVYIVCIAHMYRDYII